MPIKRSSSLREKHKASKNRNSERRKTCTPIVSPPFEKVWEREAIEINDGLTSEALPKGTLLCNQHGGDNSVQMLATVSSAAQYGDSSPLPKSLPVTSSAYEKGDYLLPVQKLQFDPGESSTDDIEMVTPGKGEEMVVYKLGEEVVPVAMGTVRKHKKGKLFF